MTKAPQSCPLVSVVMAVHNGEKFLSEALDSIVAQSYPNLEVIVVDDGSTDATSEILAERAAPNFQVRRLAGNVGQAAALNVGLELARGDFIARMDADDISLPDRILRQVEAFSRDPEMGIIGTAFKTVDENGQGGRVTAWPQTPIGVRWMSLLTCPFLHSSVMIRRQVLTDHGLTYAASFPAAQDYELWCRLLELSSGRNLSEVLVHYRRHGETVQARKREVQLEYHDKVVLRAMGREFGAMAPSAETAIGLRRVLIGRGDHEPAPSKADRVKLFLTYLGLLEGFSRKYQGAEGLEQLVSDEVARVAYSFAGQLVLSAAGLRLIWRMVKISPAVFLGGLRHIVRKVWS